MDEQTLDGIADLICGDLDECPVYRSSSYLTRFFQRVGFSDVVHDGSTRKWWVLGVLRELSENNLKAVILRLANPKEYKGNKQDIHKALKFLNNILAMEDIKVELDGATPRIVEHKINFLINEDVEEELHPLPKPDFEKLKIEGKLSEVLSARWDEVEICMNNKAYLSATILMGSMLEGLFLSVISNNPKEANLSKLAPCDNKKNKVKSFHDWTLFELINVSHDLRWIDYDVKKFTHALRDFRNFIHPHQQMLQQCYPDKDTCNISWLVVQATVNDLIKRLK